MGKAARQIALVGNPNAGKTTLFNALTGLNQKVGNFPGVTVDKKTGPYKHADGSESIIIDLPGIYSLSPKSADEQVSCEILMDAQHVNHPDSIVLVLDASNLKRNLFLATQVLDLKIPTIIALNMHDIAEQSGISIDAKQLSEILSVPVLAINAKHGEGIEHIQNHLLEGRKSTVSFFDHQNTLSSVFTAKLEALMDCVSSFASFKLAVNNDKYPWIKGKKERIDDLFNGFELDPKQQDILEISERYRTIAPLLSKVQAVVHQERGPLARTAKLDQWLTHPFWGYVAFLSVFFIVFQAVFTVATVPMDWIDAGMAWIGDAVASSLPAGKFNDFIVDGIIAGIGGVVIFVPQIAILFGLIEVLEETGYMARVSFLNDRLLRAVGMNGKSVVPLVSGFACAVPAIMAARSIEDWKERLITIMVTPLMSCSARLPVYVFLVSFIVPDEYLLGFISLQGLFMLGLYLLGLVLSGIVAFVFHKVIKSGFGSSFILELPTYRSPRWKNVGLTMWTKGLTFVTEAGKIILLISVILWGLSSYGPSEERIQITQNYQEKIQATPTEEETLTTEMNSELLRHSYAGLMGRAIEPAIRPLGFDWKMGIAIISSFAAREVFVGTMSVIYSVEGGADNISELQEKMKGEINPNTGQPLMSVATASSLLIFFVIAMQCMSTLAITKRETNSWKWPIIQFSYLTGLAYFASLITYQFLA